MIQKILLTLLLALSMKSYAATETITLDGQIEAIVSTPEQNAKGLVVIAPAKKYLMRERLFNELAAQLTKSGYVTVRFNWGSDTLVDTNDELVKAAEDLQFVISFIQQKFNFGPDSTILITKSFSTKALDRSFLLAKEHVLLTPNCSIEKPFAQTYNAMLKRADDVSIIISNDDPNCDVGQIYGTLQSIRARPNLFTTKGDHNFVVMDNVKNKANYDYQDQVVTLVSAIVDKKSK